MWPSHSALLSQVGYGFDNRFSLLLAQSSFHSKQNFFLSSRSLFNLNSKINLQKSFKSSFAQNRIKFRLISFHSTLQINPIKRFVNHKYDTITAQLTKCRQFSVNLYLRREQPQSNSKPSSEKIASEGNKDGEIEIHEKILTVPNILTMCRIVASPFLGYLIIMQQYELALYGCIIFGMTDVLDGYLARNFNMSSVLGSIIDPAADKIFISTLIVSLAYVNLLPVPLVAIFLARDVGLATSAFIIRWNTLPKPKTFKRYWDLSLPSVSVEPTLVSKINTFLQLGVVSIALLTPIIQIPVDSLWVLFLQVLTGSTTILSGLKYLFSRNQLKDPNKK